MNILDNQIDYWNKVGPNKRFGHPLNLSRLRSLLTPSSQILDFGCGYGRISSVLDRHGYQVIGVDPARTMIVEARKRHPSLTFIAVEPTSLPFTDGTFDGVLLFAVLTCIPTDDGQRRILREVSRVLRLGGVLYISDLWLQQEARNVERYKRYELKYGRYGVFELPEGVVLRHHDRQWIKELTAGFEVVGLDELEVETMNGHPAEAFQWFGRKLRPA